MLLELKIHNLAIIETLHVQFGPGLNVITGETGAGKSILLQALQLVLGARGDRTLIRTGATSAWVEAVFSVDQELAQLVQQWGFSLSEDEPLALRRVIYAQGTSRAYLNCATITLNILKQMAPLLLDAGRQHEQGLLTNSLKQLELLDRYAAALSERQQVKQLYHQLRQLLKEQEQLRQEGPQRAERAEFLRYQRQIIQSIDPQPGEQETLTQELQELTTAERCRELALQAEAVLYSSSPAVQERLATATSLVAELGSLDPAMAELHQDLQNALITIEDAARYLQRYPQTLSRDPQRLEAIQQRLEELDKLQQRYGGSLTGVLQRLEQIARELEELEQAEQRLSQLDTLITNAKQRLYQQAQSLSSKRRQAAERLMPQIQAILRMLAMPQARFAVQFSPLEASRHTVVCQDEDAAPQAVAAWGLENAVFTLSANVGEELKPLERVASGGELSRILLAFKHIMSDALPVPTLVFDEIDAGISGATATAVAAQLRQIVNQTDTQIICISHTPQVAAQADYHFQVYKQVQNGRTITVVHDLDQQERIQEVSRMLAGDQDIAQAQALARELCKVRPPSPLSENVLEN